MAPDGSGDFGLNKVIQETYENGTYWEKRMDMLYYQYVDYIIRTLGHDAQSIIDIGTAGCPYLEWFDWIPEKISFDMAKPYESENVSGIQADFMDFDFDKKYDVLTCLQVLEHVPDVVPFARRLLEIANTVIISVPYMWSETAVGDHIHDPIDRKKIRKWMGRKPNYGIVVQEPFRTPRRWIGVYDRDPTRWYGRKNNKFRVPRNRIVI
ncbi:MAG: hypothetical protein P8L32_07875 [Paracoccaceae bacterium]|jgi:hypothetical protein|nr:hypothetical protein [Paracoccaceae bacterium]